MKSIVRGILRHIDLNKRNNANEKQVKIENTEYEQRFFDRMEEEKNKTEAERKHDRFVRSNKRMAMNISLPLELKVEKPRIFQKKPGLEFEGNLKYLIENYKTIDAIFRHMSLGQLQKWSVVDDKIYRTKDHELAYDEKTGEIFLEN